MRVPNIGLTLDERKIVREGRQLAERLLRNYRDPPHGLAALPGLWRTSGEKFVADLQRLVAWR